MIGQQKHSNADRSRSELGGLVMTCCPLCDSKQSHTLGPYRRTADIIERRQCDDCGETFFIDDYGRLV